MSRPVSIDRFGRILLPKAVRERHGLEPGMPIELEEVGDEIRLKPLHAGDPHLVTKGGVLVHRGLPSGDLEGALKAHRRSRLHRMGR